MDEQDMAERLTRVEERSKSNSHRLEKLEPVVDELHNMGKAMVEMRMELKSNNEVVRGNTAMVKELGDKVDQIEKEPAKRWNNMTRTIFTTIVSTIAGALATGLVLMIAQYIK